MKNAGLILEGGATRGVFTSGALDFLLEKNCYLPYVVGVSAGACNAVDYVSKQIGRTRDCMIQKEKIYQYINMKNIIRNKSLYDMDLIFDKFPNELIPFDYDSYFKSSIKCELVVTNCITGEAEYLSENSNKTALMKICRASSSLPVVSPPVAIDYIPYLDGGLADPIPIRHTFNLGYKKCVVILTRNYGYRKKLNTRGKIVYTAALRNYPMILKTVYKRPYIYNRTLELVERLEREGKIFVIRPSIPCVKKTEKNYDVLMNFYNHGYEVMKKEYGRLMEYMGE